MTYSAIVSFDGAGRVAKYLDGFPDAAAAQAHVDAHGGEVIATLDAPVMHWLRGGDGTWSVSAPAPDASGIVTTKARFSKRFRHHYAAQGSPLGAIPTATSVDAWMTAFLAGLDDEGADAVITPEAKADAVDSWTADQIARADPSIDLIAPVLFGDAVALAAGGQTALDELARINGVTDTLFIEASELPD